MQGSRGAEGRGGLPAASLSYRQREATQFRGVTKTSGTNSGVEKFDVQFVFCDAGTKRHPKIYGFATAASAARAFDILTCKRALEKSRSVAAVLGSAQTLGTNHPTVEYTNEALLTLLHTHSRDDVIYALKQCAKRGFGMEPSHLVTELELGLEAARAEANEKERMGDARQSYEPTAKPSGERKRKSATGSAHIDRHAQLGSNRSSSSIQQLQGQHALHHHQQYHQQQQQQREARHPPGVMPGQLPAYAQQAPMPPHSQPGNLDFPNALQQQQQQQLGGTDVAGLAALAANLLGGRGQGSALEPEPARGPLGRASSFGRQGHTATAAMAGAGGSLAAAGGQPLPATSALLLQLLKGQLGDQAGAAAALLPSLIKSEPAVPAAGASIEGTDFLLECLRLGMNTSPELSCAHDLVRVWVCLAQRKAWANEQYNLPHWYYMGLVPHLQACGSVSALLSYCGHLWQLGALRVMLAALAGNLPQSTVISLLQSVAAAASPPSAAQEPTLAPLVHGAEPSLQQQATALVSALQHMQSEQEQQQAQQAQQAQVLKAAAALLGAVAPQNSPGALAAAAAATEADPAAGLPQLLAGLLGQAPGSVGNAAQQGAPAVLGAALGLPSDADPGSADPQSQLTQLMQLLSGVVNDGSLAQPGHGHGPRVAAADAGTGSGAGATVDPETTEDFKTGSAGMRAPSAAAGSRSTRTHSESLADAGQEVASRPTSLSKPSRHRPPRHGRGWAAGEQQQERGATAAEEVERSMEASMYSGAGNVTKASPQRAEASNKKQRTALSSDGGEAGQGEHGQQEPEPEFDAVVAAAAEALGMEVPWAKAGPVLKQQQQHPQQPPRKELSLEAAGAQVPHVKASPFFSSTRRANSGPLPGLQHDGMVAMDGQASKEGADNKDSSAGGAAAASAPLPTRPQPLKAQLSDPQAGGAVSAGASGDTGAAAAPPMLEMLTRAASFEAGGSVGGKQPSAFSRFGQQQQATPGSSRPPSV
ncbi:hypothetical protein N2152v2_005283 [Parachlorella kessleri]